MRTVVLVALVACSSSVETTTSAIVNGSADSGDPEVVGLVHPGMQTPYCTATLIAPRVVMTAAHCSDPTLPTSIYFGMGGADVGTVIASLDQHPHPLYDPNGLINDIALLALPSDGPATPAVVSTTPITDADIGAALRLVGFGQTSTGPPGTKEDGATTIDSYTADKFKFHANPAQTCVGDSGGPAFMTIGGVEVVAGVTSSGDPACMTSAHDARVDIYVAPFIQPYEDAIADGAAVLGKHCVSNANCTTGTCVPTDDDPTFSYCTAPCQKPSDCPAPMKCAPIGGTNMCHYDAGVAGAVGTECTIDFDCASGLCGHSGTHGGLCASACIDDSGCTPDYKCKTLTSTVAASFTGCAPKGGCNAADGRGTIWLVLAFAAIARRRRRAGSTP